jgi:hypothetical protein
MRIAKAAATAIFPSAREGAVGWHSVKVDIDALSTLDSSYS